MAKVVAVRRASDGDIEMFKLDDGTILDYDECNKAIMSGYVTGLNNVMQIGGRPIIRSDRDDDKSNNLSNLPEF